MTYIAGVDPNLDDAVRHVPSACPTVGTECNGSISVGLVNEKNLVCDRFLVWNCSQGHQGMISIIND